MCGPKCGLVVPMDLLLLQCTIASKGWRGPRLTEPCLNLITIQYDQNTGYKLKHAKRLY
jgi:hypothetical protein